MDSGDAMIIPHFTKEEAAVDADEEEDMAILMELLKL
jgi:hypothetical protein